MIYSVYLSLTTSFRIMLSKTIHTVANGKFLFLWLSSSPSYICKMEYIYLTASLSIHLFEGHFYYVLAIVNKAAVNIEVYASV